MHIRFVINNAYAVGGTVQTTFTMAQALSARGHRVEIISVRRSRDQSAFRAPKGVKLTALTREDGPPLTRRDWLRPRRLLVEALAVRPSRLIHPKDSRYARFSLKTDVALWRYLRAQRGGVIIGTRPGLNLMIAKFARADVLKIGQEHVHLASQKGLHEEFTRAYPRLDALVTLTERDAADYRDLLGDRSRVRAMPNAVPTLRGIEKVTERADAVAVAAGRLVRAKGFDLLIEAWRPVAAAHPEWTLHIYGPGVEKPALREQITQAGLAEQVKLKGFTSVLPKRLAGASLFVLSSRLEGFPMVLLEAMGCGTPVVAFDCPTGPAELIDDAVNGLLVEAESVPALSAALLRAIEDPQLRARMGEAGRETSRAYSPDALAQRWEDLFEELAARRGLRL